MNSTKVKLFACIGDNWKDTFVAGFREDVTEAMKKLNAHLENNCIQTERFICPSKLYRRYLCELRQNDLCSIETQLANFEVKIQNGRGDEEFVISGKKEGLKHTRGMLDALVVETKSKVFQVKQPGLKKYFSSGKGDRLVKSVEKDHACAIHVERSIDEKQEGMHSREAEATGDSGAASGGNDDGPCADGRRSDDDDDDEQEKKAVVHSGNPTALVTTNGHKISWKPGYIQSENVRSSKFIKTSIGTLCRYSDYLRLKMENLFAESQNRLLRLDEIFFLWSSSH